MSAPDRIWLTTTESGKVDDFTQWIDSQLHLHPSAPRTEYVRADIAADLLAALEHEVKRSRRHLAASTLAAIARAKGETS